MLLHLPWAQVDVSTTDVVVPRKVNFMRICHIKGEHVNSNHGGYIITSLHVIFVLIVCNKLHL